MKKHRGFKIAAVVIFLYSMGVFGAVAANESLSLGFVALFSNLIGFGFLAWLVFWCFPAIMRQIRSQSGPHPERIRFCTRCGTVDEYRDFGNRRVGCPRCGSPEIIPTDTPAARIGIDAQNRLSKAEQTAF